jgi:DNA (cytosine-5)-methyltransferase 1
MKRRTAETMENTIISLCTGTGQLERSLTLAGVRARLAYVADPDKGASRLLAVRHPDVPNLGDITRVDWTRLPSPFAICAGYPCQGFSLSGLRLGENDARFIWPHVFAAVRDLRPRIVLLENVPGHLSLGFGRVLGDLASIGYDTNWTCVEAAEVGAAHKRNRVFILAWQRGDDPAEALGIAPGGGWGGGTDPVLSLLPTARTSDTNGSGSHGDGGLDLRTTVETMLPTPTATAARRNDSPGELARKTPALGAAVHRLPTPRARDYRGPAGPGFNTGDLPSSVLELVADDADRWGVFGPAIRRWESVIGRPAPDPTVRSAKTGKDRLSPWFVEWFMGHEAGFVTDLYLPDVDPRGTGMLSRTQVLRLLGNGVMALQGAEAVRRLVGM